MFDFNSWEFLALGVAAILIFGPERLPGIIRKAGEYYAQLQSVAASFRRELEAEASEITEPLREAAAEISQVGQQIAATGKDVAEQAVAPANPTDATEGDDPAGPDEGDRDSHQDPGATTQSHPESTADQVGGTTEPEVTS